MEALRPPVQLMGGPMDGTFWFGPVADRLKVLWDLGAAWYDVAPRFQMTPEHETYQPAYFAGEAT